MSGQAELSAFLQGGKHKTTIFIVKGRCILQRTNAATNQACDSIRTCSEMRIGSFCSITGDGWMRRVSIYWFNSCRWRHINYNDELNRKLLTKILLHLNDHLHNRNHSAKMKMSSFILFTMDRSVCTYFELNYQFTYFLLLHEDSSQHLHSKYDGSVDHKNRRNFIQHPTVRTIAKIIRYSAIYASIFDLIAPTDARQLVHYCQLSP